MTKNNQLEAKISEVIHNAEEYRKLTLNYILPDIIQACKEKKSHIHVSTLSDNMVIYLRSKGFKYEGYNTTCKISW